MTKSTQSTPADANQGGFNPHIPSTEKPKPQIGPMPTDNPETHVNDKADSHRGDRDRGTRK